MIIFSSIRFSANGGKAYSYQLDVTDRLKVYALAEQIKREVGDVIMLVNNAGIVTGKKILDAPDHLMVKTMEVNTISHFWVSCLLGETRPFLPFEIALIIPSNVDP